MDKLSAEQRHNKALLSVQTGSSLLLALLKRLFGAGKKQARSRLEYGYTMGRALYLCNRKSQEK